MDWQGQAHDQGSGQGDWESQEWYNIAMDYVGWRMVSKETEQELPPAARGASAHTPSYTPPSYTPSSISAPKASPSASAAPKRRASFWARLFGALFGRKGG
jgi:hypothetical protein